MVDTTRVADGWTPERIAANRKRIVRQTWAIVAVIVIGLFLLMDSPSEKVRGASGTTYRIVETRFVNGPQWNGLYVRYLSSAQDDAARAREFADLSPALVEFARLNERDRIEVAAARRVFRVGLFHVDQSVSTRYRLVDGQWRPE